MFRVQSGIAAGLCAAIFVARTLAVEPEPGKESTHVDVRFSEADFRPLAEKVVKQVRSVGKDSIAVGFPTAGPKLRQSTYGSAILLHLESLIKSQRIAVSDSADLWLSVTFSLSGPQARRSSFSIVIIAELRLVNEDGTPGRLIATLQHEILARPTPPDPIDPDGVGLIVGPVLNATGEVSSNETPETRFESIVDLNRKASEAPGRPIPAGFSLDGHSVVRTRVGSKVGLEVLREGEGFRFERTADGGERVVVNGPGRPVSTDVLGQATISLDKGNAIAARLINDSDYDVAVQLYLDSLSAFAFSAEPCRIFVVPKRSKVVIPGWFLTRKDSARFQVVDLAQSALAQKLGPEKLAHLSSPLTIGTITATFSLAWKPDEPPPPDQGPLLDPTRGEAIAIGQGQLVEKIYVEAPRIIGPVAQVITIRYARPR